MKLLPARYPFLSSLLCGPWPTRYRTLAQIVLARNVSNVEAIDQFVKTMYNPAGDYGPPEKVGKIHQWMNSNLRKYLIRDYDEVKPVHEAPAGSPPWLEKSLQEGQPVVEVQIDKALRDKIQHVLDYLRSDQAPQRLDALTVPEAIKQSQAWTKQLTKQKIKPGEAAEGEEIIKQYPDGYSWRKLISQAALTQEGNLMGHCVGSYWKQVESGRVEIWSLRDQKNEPHATLELNPKYHKVDQIKGKQNEPVIAKYHPYIKDVLGDQLSEWEVDDVELTNAGMYKIDGQIKNLEEIKADPKLAKKLLHRVIREDRLKSTGAKIEINDDGIAIGGVGTYDFLSLLNNSISSRQITELTEILEDHYDGPDWHWSDVNISDLFEALSKKDPATYKKLMTTVQKIELDTDSDYAREEGKWLQEHQDELPEVYNAVQTAIYDGWSVGTSDAAYKHVTGLLSDLKWDDGSYTYEADSKTLWLVLSWAALTGHGASSLETEIDRPGFESEFDEKAAEERFVEALHEEGYSVKEKAPAKKPAPKKKKA